MSTNDDGLDLSEQEMIEMLGEDDYDPATDVCGLLWPIMSGVFAEDLAELVLREGVSDMEK